MAKRENEAWLTIAVEDEFVKNAIVLAESLRDVKTTRKIVVIASQKLAAEQRIALKKAFDSVFYLDKDEFSCAETTQPQYIQAIVQAFSLFHLQTCLLISANSLILENTDKLFEDNTGFGFVQTGDDGFDVLCLKFKPNRKLWSSLLEMVCRSQTIVSTNTLMIWLSNQNSGNLLNCLPDNILLSFSIANGMFLKEPTYAKIIQFVDIKPDCDLQDEMESLLKLDLGLYEKLIVQKWLEIYGKTLSVQEDGQTRIFENPEEINDFLNEPIAIIGMSCRYPGANNLKEFWNLMYEGKEGIQDPPPFRWTEEQTIRVTKQDRKTQAGFLNVPVDQFDEKFFGVSPKEAVIMDAQIRLLHEVFWESLEDSGTDPLSLYGSHTGIFTGSWINDYKDLVQESGDNEFFRKYMGNGIGAGAARLSFLLGLTGPSIATESGCSSAIVAVDLAVKSLRNGETNLAVAAGVNLLLNPFSRSNLDFCIAPNGRCKTFDSKADGFGRAEGCGVLVLKRLTDALQDRDNIWGIIRGSAVAQEGLSRSLGTPTVHCEALAMQLAIKDANILPEHVDFVETHGSGTAVGDPIEVAAIAKAYYSPKRERPLVIGCVKTNVGHTESCSGITGIMKTVLAMHYQLIPKHLNFESLNPEIFLDSIPATIPMEPIPWPKVKDRPRIAGVSSFGITGTDGHVIIQEAPDYDLPKFTLQMERPYHIFKISAKTISALEKLLELYQNYFEEKATAEGLEEGRNDGYQGFAHAAFSANVGRANFSHRAFIVANNYRDAAKKLSKVETCEVKVAENEKRKLCLLFTGQGSQYKGMAKTLYETSPIFRMNFDYCQRILKETYNLSITQVLWDPKNSTEELSRTIYSQTCIFCVEYCLLKLWQSWGIQPDFVLGHSLGEFCAAVAADILDFKDALKLVVERSKLIDSLPRGSMLVLRASKPEVENLLASAKIDLDFAAENSHEQTVVAGDTEIVEKFLKFCSDQGVKGIMLEATHAFHSRHMNPILEKYRKIVKMTQFKNGNGYAQFVSGLEGKIIEDSFELNADYWIRHTREKVSFLNACSVLQESECYDFLEVGPHPVLSSFVMMNSKDSSLNILPSLRRKNDDWFTILNSLGKLYLLGYKVNWKGYDEPYDRKKVSLPFYPFNRKSFWVECTKGNALSVHPLLGSKLENASALNIFQNHLHLQSVPYIKDHCIGNRILFPGACYVEMCLSAGYYVTNGFTQGTDLLSPHKHAMKLENIKIDAPLEMTETKLCKLQVVVDLPNKNEHDDKFQSYDQDFPVKVYHQNNHSKEIGKWVLHSSSIFNPVPYTKDSIKKWNPNRVSEIISKSRPVNSENFYKNIKNVGLTYGESFQSIKKFWFSNKSNDTKAQQSDDEVVAEIEIPSDFKNYVLHPLVIDAAFQSGVATKHCYEKLHLKVPVFIKQVTIFSWSNYDSFNDQSKMSFYLYSWFESDKYYTFVSTPDLIPVALLEGIELVDTTVNTIESVLEQQLSRIPNMWEESWKPITSPFRSNVELPDIDRIFSDSSVQQELAAVKSISPELKQMYMKTTRLIYLYILDVFHKLNWKPKLEERIDVKTICTQLQILPQHHQLVRFYLVTLEKEKEGILKKLEGSELWMICSMPPSCNNLKSEIEHLYLSLKNSTDFRVVNEIYKNISNYLPKILKGEESALVHLFPTRNSSLDKLQLSAEAFYLNNPCSRYISEMFRIIFKSIYQETRALESNNQNKVFRILEVGAGTGSLTLSMVGWIQKVWGHKFQLYYTDISPHFFAKAAEKLDKFGYNVKYAIFNIDESPLSQGIPVNYFDMVVATEVLHATKSLESCLVHLRQSLRPGGFISFCETVVKSRDLTFLFGPLEGYWRFEDLQWRQHSCCVGVKIWKKLLFKCGFSSVHFAQAFEDRCACITAVKDPTYSEIKLPICDIQSTKLKNKWVLFADKSNFYMLSEVGNMLISSGNRVFIALKSGEDKKEEMEDDMRFLTSSITIVNLQGDLSDVESLFKDGEDNLLGIIFAWGMDMNVKDQAHVALPFLNIVKTLVNYLKPPQLFVLTQGVHAVHEDKVASHPSASTLFGMAKSLKNEKFDIFVRCIDLEPEISPKQIVDQVLFELVMTKGENEANRVQVAYRDSVRYEPRLTKCTMETQNNELKIPLGTDRYHLVLPKSKRIDDLKFNRLEPRHTLMETEVEITVKAYSLNFRDILTILKPSVEFENTNQVGVDFAGIVSKSGSIDGKLNIGDRVFGASFTQQQLSSHMLVNSKMLLKIPETMTFWEASTLSTVICTAYYCLMTIANMKKEDTVLIHTGSGGVGLAAIQLAKHVGADIITTAGNERKRAYLKSIGIYHVFHSRDSSFEKEILRVTNGNGVNIVLNSITGPKIKEATLNVCAKNAKFLEMSRLSIWTTEEVKHLRPDVNYRTVDLTLLDPKEWLELFNQLDAFLRNGVVKPIPFVKFDALHIRQALKYFQNAMHIGKVVCAMPEIRLEKNIFSARVPLFNEESTYWITGGLGGIGLKICKWMVKHGAKNLVLTGRSQPKPEVAEQIDKLNKKVLINVMVKLGDVGNYENCKTILQEIYKNKKPLRGVMHCAGTVRDDLYTNQTWKSFEETFNPKVTGTWNIHNLTLHLRLEHFVLFSSTAALLGTPAQSNHAAATCFEDAFVHYRHSLGLAATTINWGQWSQVGVAREITLIGISPTSVKRMLTGLKIVLQSPKRQISLCNIESYTNLALLCPSFKFYLDEKLWNLENKSESRTCSHRVTSEQIWNEIEKPITKEAKIVFMTNCVKNILRAALRLETNETVGEDISLIEIGVDSLMLIELKNCFQDLLGSRVNVPAYIFKHSNTLRQISISLINLMLSGESSLGKEQYEEPLPQWELIQLLRKDCILSEHISAILGNVKPATRPSEIKRVLITGITGKLAPYLLSQLAQSYKHVEKIYCLFRTKTYRKSGTKMSEVLSTTLKNLKLEMLVDMKNIECILGDVACKYFGLSEDKYEFLSENIDAVIHCAAKINYSENYFLYEDGTLEDIRSVNVGGTKNILEFASTLKIKHVYYPSGFYCGIFEECKDGSLSDDWPGPHTIQTIVNFKLTGIKICKFACELLLKQAFERKIPVKVFRFSWIAGDSRTGQLSYLNNMYILRFLTFLKLKVIPSVVIPAIFLPVDICADHSLNIFFRNDTPFGIFNIGHPQPQVELEFVKVAEEEFGIDLHIVEFDKYAELLKENEVNIKSLRALYNEQQQFELYMSAVKKIIQGYRDSPETFFKNIQVSQFIPNYEASVPPSMHTLTKDLHYLKRIGLFKKFGI